MPHSLVDLPEPFRSALGDHTPERVAGLDAATPEALFGRGLARAAIGDRSGARADFEAALPSIGPAARIEAAFLSLVGRAAQEEAIATAEAVLAEPDGAPALRARAHHLCGLALGRMRRSTRSLDHLLHAADLYEAGGDRAGTARVRDSMGMVLAATGRLDQALASYTLSMVDKMMIGDRAGIGITLGNLGRLLFAGGRHADALACLDRDLEIVTAIGDRRAAIRVRTDIGRVKAAQGDHHAARGALEACLAEAAALDAPDLVFFAHKELAEIDRAEGRPDDAAAHVAAMDASLPPGGERYFDILLLEARGATLAAQGDDRAAGLLERAVDGFVDLDLPEQEIGARLTLARCHAGAGRKRAAEHCLVEAVRLARRNRLYRLLDLLNEEMTRLDLTDGLVEEAPRPMRRAEAGPGAAEAAVTGPDAYLLREKIGVGGFGEVWRAWDPARAETVALKRIALRDLFSPTERDSLVTSLRVELEAGSRLRHPGIERVYAIGLEADGDMYVVKQFVPGDTLTAVMTHGEGDALAEKLTALGYIAEALGELHAAGVVHRDLKPDNVILREVGDGTVLPVLIDFGVAHTPGRPQAEGDFVGTMDYMAPEQAARRRIDGRADLYSLGVIAFEWIAGRPPIPLDAERLEDRVKLLLKRSPDRLARIVADIPPDLGDLVDGLLDKRPERRPWPAEDVAERFHTLAAML